MNIPSIIETIWKKYGWDEQYFREYITKRPSHFGMMNDVNDTLTFSLFVIPDKWVTKGKNYSSWIFPPDEYDYYTYLIRVMEQLTSYLPFLIGKENVTKELLLHIIKHLPEKGWIKQKKYRQEVYLGVTSDETLLPDNEECTSLGGNVNLGSLNEEDEW